MLTLYLAANSVSLSRAGHLQIVRAPGTTWGESGMTEVEVQATIGNWDYRIDQPFSTGGA